MPKPEENRRDSAYVDIKKTPPPVQAPIFNTINKRPRDTAASTTFTVSGQKITIIGHARTGKTSLKNALFGRDFKDMTFPTVKAPPKPTIVVKPLKIIEEHDNDNAPDLAEDDADVNVQYEIWDTPGQKVLEYIPPLYITGSFCVFVVYDITDKFAYQRAKYWVNYLEENAKGYDNVVLIGNKYDLHETQRVVKAEEVQEYAEEHGIFFIEISVKTKHNFDVLLSWLSQRTQEKFQEEIQAEMKDEQKMNDKESKMRKDLGIDDGENKEDNDKDKGAKQRKKDKKRSKSWLKQHQRNHQTIQLDKMDKPQHKKSKSCCF